MKDNVKGLIFMVVFVTVIVGSIVAIARSTDKNTSSNTTTVDPNSASVTSAEALNPDNKDAGYLDRLAKYLTAKGAKFYGASWCTHCQKQKKVFGDAVKDLPYVECSSSTTQKDQAAECKAVNFVDNSSGTHYTEIQGYPTWIYQGVGYSGEMNIPKLAAMVGFTDSSQ